METAESKDLAGWLESSWKDFAGRTRSVFKSTSDGECVGMFCLTARDGRPDLFLFVEDGFN